MLQLTPISFRLWQTDKQAFAKALGASFTETGFAIISDHTIPKPVIDAAQSSSEDFFAQDVTIKDRYADAQGGHQRGYSPFKSENAKGRTESDLKEFWHTGRSLPDDSPYRAVMKDTPKVAELPEFNAATRALYAALDTFGTEVLKGVALYLDMEEDWFTPHVNFGNSILRLLHYPPQKTAPPKGSVRAGAHEDINLITLLLGAEEAGLQAKHKSGVWLDINAPEGAVVVNCGDMLQRLTGGILPSTTHRVLNPSPERAKFPRYSAPFFLHPNNDFMIKALPQCLERGGVAEAPITAQDYLQERLIEIGLLKPA